MAFDDNYNFFEQHRLLAIFFGVITGQGDTSQEKNNRFLFNHRKLEN
ncbi:MAG: hypothetical protein MI892_00745 [Desulfobacterales bacterium]|nr:hypothetical protein [Desulfobacterales bacterium]